MAGLDNVIQIKGHEGLELRSGDGGGTWVELPMNAVQEHPFLVVFMLLQMPFNPIQDSLRGGSPLSHPILNVIVYHNEVSVTTVARTVSKAF